MIGEKIIKIMSEIEPIEKTEVDEEKNYKYPKMERIIEMVNPLLVKNSVAIIPVQVSNFLPQGNKVFLTMKYHFLDMESENKDFIEVEIAGSGFDEKGRAVYAALTGAYRYAIQQVFAIPIVDEVKNDDTSNQENNNNVTKNEEETEDSVQQDVSEMSTTDLDSLFSSTKV